MKRYISLLLAVILIMTLTACGSYANNNPDATPNTDTDANTSSGSVESAVLEPESNDDDSLTGEYRCVSGYMISAGKEYDITDTLEQGWADKSYYLYLIIDPNNGYYDFISVTVKNGVESRSDSFLDPQTLIVHQDHLFSDPGYPIEIGDDGSITISDKTYGMVYVKTDEIPS